MKKLLMLGTNSGTIEMLQYAKEIGVYTIVTDYLDPIESAGKIIADEYWMISTSDLDTLECKCKEEGVSAIISGISDFNTTMMVKLAHRLDLPCYCDLETWDYSIDKSAFKSACIKYGVPTAKQYFISKNLVENGIDDICFPVIVKPTDSSGNRGFSYCNSKDELIPALKNAKDYSKTGNVIIEQRLCGRDHTAFYALADGEARLVNFFISLSEPGMPDNAYTINTTVTDSLHQYLNEIDPYVRKLLKGLGYRDGVVWIEFMPDENGVLNALEIGHRLSGEMLWMPLSKIRGFNSLKWMVDYAINGKNDIKNLPENQINYLDECACSYILWTKADGIVKESNGFDLLNQIEDVNVNIITKKGKYVNAFGYGAVITFSSKNVDEIIHNIKYINNTVEILDKDENNILSYFNDFSSLKELEKKRD